jgi:hypothetical protein
MMLRCSLGWVRLSHLARLPAETLLREYDSYFIINGLTGHLCTYILSNVHSGCELLLTMRDAHAASAALSKVAPSLLEYWSSPSPNEVLLLYDSPRQHCTVLLGAIEGAAERYREMVHIEEQSCMKQGAALCQLKASCSPQTHATTRYDTPERAAQQAEKTALMKQIWAALPEAGTVNGLTLIELQEHLKRSKQADAHKLRPAVLLEALHRLQFAGYAMSTAIMSHDDFARRRYWRVHRHI